MRVLWRDKTMMRNESEFNKEVGNGTLLSVGARSTIDRFANPALYWDREERFE